MKPLKPLYQFELFKGADEQWYWRVRSRNGQVLATSEGYTKRSTAQRVARRFGYHVIGASIVRTVDSRKAGFSGKA